jgi:adenylate cyclase
MTGEGVEIEYRFFIPDFSKLPALGKGSKMIQCYLPKWKVEVVNGNLSFENKILKSDLQKEAVDEFEKIIEDGGTIAPRIRLVNGRAFVTVKGPMENYARMEWEWEVLEGSVKDLVMSYRFPFVLKTRYEIPTQDDLCWEIDVFEGDNAGLVLAELEVPTSDYSFTRPEWVGEDVTNDDRFGNGSLARDPWCDWADEI